MKIQFFYLRDDDNLENKMIMVSLSIHHHTTDVRRFHTTVLNIFIVDLCQLSLLQ